MKEPTEVVIILHGIFRTSWSMKLYEYYLRYQGFTVLNLTYPSLRYDLDRLAEIVGEKIMKSPQVQNAATVHFLTHSMGGVVTRYVLNTHEELRLKTKNVVMLVPPNGGSEMADYLHETGWLKPLYRLFFGPAGQQLTTRYALNYPGICGNLGVIAGTRSINPLSRFVFNKGVKHDGIISHQSMMYLAGKDVEQVPASHTSILCNIAAIKKAATFLKVGTFSPPM